ncbi:hypothetical protein E2C01_000125 [Portunus trituberculatus]|uniref:Uncharacterized protein n=1 Tax=Portunus trituberculatus TaxID=210409 RepID=A0A5B7CFP1_PORTR|nr:hypothetical protein [Portunus trituberculatus]
MWATQIKTKRNRSLQIHLGDSADVVSDFWFAIPPRRIGFRVSMRRSGSDSHAATHLYVNSTQGNSAHESSSTKNLT